MRSAANPSFGVSTVHSPPAAGKRQANDESASAPKLGCKGSAGSLTASTASTQAETALVLALPQAARIFAPAGWGWLADRYGAKRGIVVLSCAVMTLGFAFLPAATGVVSIAMLIAITGVFSSAALPLVEAMTLSSL